MRRSNKEVSNVQTVEIVAVFTLAPGELFGGGVPFIVCKSQKQLEKDVMDMCRIIGATSHEIGGHVFVIKR